MHPDEAATDAELVERLLVAQFPAWAHLPLTRIGSTGTDNALYRLGPELAVRMPRRPSAAGQVAKEARWLPVLAPHLPLAIPVPLATGLPGEGYPHPWGVYRWLEGETAHAGRLADPGAAAESLAEFLTALRAIDASDAPLPGAHNSYRGVPLAARDRAVRAALAHLDGEIDTAAAMAAWERALAAPAWAGPPVWIHGDLSPFNLLARDGELTAVIDFGCLGAGDPACDLQPAWNLLPPAARERFRARLAPGEAAWERGRGWALSVAIIQLPYYRDTNPGLAANARFTIAAVLAER